MEGNERNFNVSEYCRICLNRTRNSFDKMFDLNIFLPIIRFLSQTKLMTGKNTPMKICESCANGLIFANVFRIKVIESNAKCRELLKSIQNDSSIVNNQESIERIQENVGKINTKRRDRFLEDPASVLKVELEDYNENNEIDFHDDMEVYSSKEKPKNLVYITKEPSCVVCARSLEENNSWKVDYFRNVLNKVLPSLDINDPDSICLSCMELTKATKSLFELRDRSRGVKQETECKKEQLSDECQFCLVNDIFSTRTPKYLVHKFNMMPMCKENEENKIKSEAKSCKECMKLLKQLYLLLTQYFKSLKIVKDTLKLPAKCNKNEAPKENVIVHKKNKSSKNKRAVKRDLLQIVKDEKCSDESNEEAIPLSKYIKRRRKKFKLCSKPKYVKPNLRAGIPEDYQCHMSDFEEYESDHGILTPRMGEPLNQPFQHNYKSCNECKLKYITDYELEVHYDVVHRTKGDVCEHCNKKFINFVGVKAHKHKVHFADCSSVSLFRELCEICGVLTKTLEEHQSIHSDARPFVCHQCAHSSKTKDLLAAHVRAMHTGEKRYGCKYCEKRFSYSADRARHEISSHTKQYKYVCRTCNKGFLKKNFLTSHQKTHEGTFLDEM